MKRRITFKRVVGETMFYAVLIAFAVIMVLPFEWSLSTSLQHDQDIFSIPLHWIPTHFTFQQYVKAFTTVPFGRYFLNSFLLSVAGVATNLFFGSLAGYAFARMQFRGRETMFRTLLASMMVPGVVTLIPSFIIVHSFPLTGGNNILGMGGTGLLNNYLAVILPGAAGAFAVFMMKQFFVTLPSDLGEAAKIDGCSEFRIFWKIYLPLCKPAIATLGVFTFQAGWNSFLWPLIVFTNNQLATVQMGLASFSYAHKTDFGPLMAASIVVMLPIVIVFIYAQRYMTQGIAFTGTK